MEGRLPADRLWDFQGYDTLMKLRRTLAVLGKPEAQSMGWKAFRAGKATSLAVAGSSVGKILQMGEWKSAAVVNYVDENVLDEAPALAVLADSDSDTDANNT